MQVVINNILTQYSKTGSGPVVVLLHGWGDSTKTFTRLQEVLSAKFTVLSLDLPGFGVTEKPDRPYTLADYVAFIAEFLRKTETKKVYSYLGHSNGGSIAVKGLGANVLSSDKLVLLASAGIRSRDTLKQRFFRIIAKIVKLPLYLLPKNTRDKVRKKIYGLIGSDLFVAEGMEETFRNVVSEDLLNEAAAIHSDTLLLYGKDDKATPPLFGEMYQEVIKRSHLEVVDGAGHFIHLDKPDIVSGKIEEFLKS
jgi:pimeloyl-ACP methyl ester carboxylesterase